MNTLTTIPGLDRFEDARPVPGYSDLYATAAGQIVSTRRGKAQLRKLYLFRTHLRVNVPKSGTTAKEAARVHQLVALAFCGPRPTPKHSAVHLNLTGTDNRAENIRWMSRTESHDHLVALKRHAHGEGHGMHVLTEPEVIEIKQELRAGTGKQRIARQFGVAKGTVQFIAKGETWKHLDGSQELAGATDRVLGGTSQGG